MSEDKGVVHIKCEMHDNFSTIASDDLTITLGREVSTINFYQDVYMPKTDSSETKMRPDCIKKMLRLAIKVPTMKLLGMGFLLPDMVKTLRERTDLNRIFLHVDDSVNISRKMKTISKGKVSIPTISPFFELYENDKREKVDNKNAEG